MCSHHSTRRALTAVSLFIAFAVSQTCYYPDGATVSTDVPCNSTATASSCCPSDSFCMANGLCFGGGIVSRSSCTDATWDSDACAQYCTTENSSTDVGITPCSSGSSASTFVCGLDNTYCQTESSTFTMSSGGSGFILRPSQIAALVEPALEASSTATTSASAATATACSTQTLARNTTGLYTSGDMAGLGCGLGLPLFFALCIALFLLRRERQKYAPPKLMYKLPENCKDEFTFRPPQRLGSSPGPPSSDGNSLSVRSVRGRDSSRTLNTLESQKPAHVKSFLERYETMKKKGQVHEMDLGRERHELESTPTLTALPRQELGDRMSL